MRITALLLLTQGTRLYLFLPFLVIFIKQCNLCLGFLDVGLPCLSHITAQMKEKICVMPDFGFILQTNNRLLLANFKLALFKTSANYYYLWRNVLLYTKKFSVLIEKKLYVVLYETIYCRIHTSEKAYDCVHIDERPCECFFGY